MGSKPIPTGGKVRRGKCSICGKNLPPYAGVGRKRKTCSLACAKKRERLATLDWNRRLLAAKKAGRDRCPTCGRLIPVKIKTTLPIVS